MSNYIFYPLKKPAEFVKVLKTASLNVAKLTERKPKEGSFLVFNKTAFRRFLNKSASLLDAPFDIQRDAVGVALPAKKVAAAEKIAKHENFDIIVAPLKTASSPLSLRRDYGSFEKGDFIKKAFEEMHEDKEARFEKGKDMDIDDPRLPEEFRETNKNPPPSVKKLREKLKKKARGASGKYGFTKKIERESESLIRKIRKIAQKCAKDAMKKDQRVVEFFSIHAKRGGSLAAKILVEECKGLMPKFASYNKNASISLYGLPERTVKIGMNACAEFRLKCGVAIGDFQKSKENRYGKLMDFFNEHKKKSRCKATKFILSSCPEQTLVKLGSGTLIWEEE